MASNRLEIVAISLDKKTWTHVSNHICGMKLAHYRMFI